MKYFVVLTFSGLLVACQNEPRLTETDVQATVEAGIAGTMVAQGVVNTFVAMTVVAQDVAAATVTANLPTPTPIPATILETPTPVDTATPPPTNMPAPPQPTRLPATATLPSNPVFGGQFLPNPSFEDGWYNMWGLPELRLPNNWSFEWDEGPTEYGSVLPATR